MTPIDFSPIIPKIRKIIDTHKLADGSYGRWLTDTEPTQLAQMSYFCKPINDKQ